MITRKTIKLILALSFLCLMQVQPSYANPESSVDVRVTGSGNTRDGALVDACRLAVAKVHGSRIAGLLLKTNEVERKGGDGKDIVSAVAVSGNSNSVTVNGGSDAGSQFVETRDMTGLSFDGLLLSYSLISQKEPGVGSSLWQIEIDAKVLKAIPDRFAGRIMVVTPSLQSLMNKLKSKPVADTLSSTIEQWFTNSKQFALLERSDETVIDDELARAASDKSAVNQKSKLASQKSADVVILVDGGEIEFEEKSTSFKTTSRQSHTCTASLRITIKAIDTATKGEIGRSVVELEAKKSTTDPMRSRKAALADLADQLELMMPMAGLEIMAALDVTRLVVDEDGYINVIAPVDGMSLESVSSLSLSYSKSDTETISLGVFELEQEGARITGEWKEKGIEVNQVLSFKPIYNK